MNNKKFLSIILSIIMVLSIALPIYAADAEGNVIVLYTNDVHCAIDDYSLLAAYRTELIEEGNTVITVDAGDAIQGAAIGTLTDGSAVVDIMNEVGYDYAIPGNHEFDYGMDVFLDISKNEAEYNYMSCNFMDLENETTVFEPYYIEEINGEKIAFVGITTPEAITKSTPAYFQDDNGNYIYGFSEDNFYTVIQDTVDDAVGEGAEIVVAVGHLGIDGTTDGWKSTDVIANTTGIDVLIDAHAHESIAQAIYDNKAGEDVILSSTGTKFANFGQLTLNSDGTAKTELISPDTIDVENMSEAAQNKYAEVKGLVDSYNAQVEYLYEELGTSFADLIAYDDDNNWLVRKAETNMGNFVADAYVYAIYGAEIALVNSGGIRAEIDKGPVTRMDLMNINPWNNEMCVIYATGQQIVDALEHGARLYPETSGGFLQTSSSLTYEIDAWKESPVIVDSKGNFAGIDETKERRVTNVKYMGEAIDLKKEYAVAGTLYMLTQGGDGYTMFKNNVAYDADITDTESLFVYLTEGLDGVITAEQYGNTSGDGRIKINVIDPDSEDTTGKTDDTDSETDDNICDRCGEVHINFFEKLLCFFKYIVNLIIGLFK